MSTKKPLKTKKTYDARQAFQDGVMAGAEYFANASRHRVGAFGDVILSSLRDNIKDISDSFNVCKEFNEKRQKDWRIGHFASPKDKSFLKFPWSKGIVKVYVVDTHPSGTEGIECVDGVLELVFWWVTPTGYIRDPYTLYAPADQWAVA